MLTHAPLKVAEIAGLLPPFPRVVERLNDVLDDDALTIDELVRIARFDPVITGQILSAANQIRRLRDAPELSDPFAAASLIGFDRVRRIVLGSSINQYLQTISNTPDTPFFYGHSLAVAIVSQELALLANLPADKAYIAGILHDIGQLCLHVLDARAYREISTRASQDGRILDHEREHFGCDHSEIGSLLAEHWHLPESVQVAIATHHQEGKPLSPLQAVVTLAETLSRALDLPPSPNNRVTHLNQQACELLKIDFSSEAMQNCFGRCRARFRQAIQAQ